MDKRVIVTSPDVFNYSSLLRTEYKEFQKFETVLNLNSINIPLTLFLQNLELIYF